jgi:PLD-like domain
MAVMLRVLQNGDEALLVWGVDAPIANCVGFAIGGRKTIGGKATDGWLDNYVGFADEKPEGKTKPSIAWPFQSFSWTDYGLEPGEGVSYRVVPMMLKDGALRVNDELASDWSPEIDPQAVAGSKHRAFFNRGFFMSQFVARYCQEHALTPKQLAEGLSDQDERKIHDFLAGNIRTQLLQLLAHAKEDGGHVYAALFELTDAELIQALVALGDHAHLVLANGSVTQQRGEPLEDARKRDENADARKALEQAGAEISLTERFTSPGPLGHNKFLVVVDPRGVAQRVWTGSTNWSLTGLCTQHNNAIVIDDQGVAEVYLQQWQHLKLAKNEFPQELLAGNIAHDAGSTTVWFTPAKEKSADLQTLRDLVKEAKHGILFLMFQPGATGLYNDVIARDGEPGLFMRGVISEIPHEGNGQALNVTVVGAGEPTTHHLDVIQPEGLGKPFAWWVAAEITRRQFLTSQSNPHGIGHAIIHSKVLVVDPLSENPVVVTGSHNFSNSASGRNDENFLVIRGDKQLAEAYLVNIMSAWRHYRTRASGAISWAGSVRDDTWMAKSLRAHKQDTFFWGV